MTTISATATSAGSLDARAIQRALNAKGARLAEMASSARRRSQRSMPPCRRVSAVWLRTGRRPRLRIAYEQIMLRDAGLYRGAIDGLAGPQTRAALAQWERLTSSASAAGAIPPWLAIARSYIGTHEGVGARDNPVVLEMYRLAGHPEIRHDSVAWCTAFVGACLAEAGQDGTGTLWALDYAKWGQSLLSPIVGAIATKKRTGGGHTFFVTDFDAKTVWGCGGNQGNQVSIVPYARSASRAALRQHNSDDGATPVLATTSSTFTRSRPRSCGEAHARRRSCRWTSSRPRLRGVESSISARDQRRRRSLHSSPAAAARMAH
ncbi:TIGR02594 family protein [Methylosinus sp. H3A]|uniref:NlpC/P60 family protein n=1 Tax=Methylosinus sp. H3A TaxID=2785786 RepID=UPI0018C33B6A|nr:TIGR02594 family protein [Methylosinus sp. H3A]MBG0811960.1 TIGR02594 family protein [Methylosinus sp. H3A]